MTKSNRNLKARAGIAAAVLAGGAAAGVTAVAASGHGTTSSAQSAGYSMSVSHPAQTSAAMNTAMTALQSGNQAMAFKALASMAMMRNFAQTRHHGATLAMQRGLVELATKRFLVVKSANGQQHLWWVRGSKIVNATASPAAMRAMTGSTSAAAATAMAGSAGAASAMTAPAAKPTTITVNAGGQTITITISGSAASVSAPAGTPAAASATMPAAPASSPMMKSTQSAFAAGNGLKRGDLVLVSGIRKHGLLIAKLVVFAAPAPTATPTATATAPATTPATANVAPTASASQFSGSHA